MSALAEVKLYDNRHTGTVPSEYGMLKNMEILEIDDMLLTGTIPTELGNCECKWLQSSSRISLCVNESYAVSSMLVS